MLSASPNINQSLDHPLLEKMGIDLAVKRLDLIHPEVSGNKFFKLKYNLKNAQDDQTPKILTFGGAYSNHIQAVAAACKLLHIPCVGIIRGEETLPLNPTLSAAKSNGMQLHYLSRSAYKTKAKPEFLEDLKNKFGEFFLIPEGGTNQLAIKGASEILTEEDYQFDFITVAMGTGGTMAGILEALSPNQTAIGFSSLKGDFIKDEFQSLITQHQIHQKAEFIIETSYHFGGYAKFQQALIEFIWWFYEQFGINLDPIYTGKHFYGIWDLIKKGFFPNGTKILSIHTGGLQGIEGFTERTGIKLPTPSK